VVLNPYDLDHDTPSNWKVPVANDITEILLNTITLPI
jgi:hypothetical protein